MAPSPSDIARSFEASAPRMRGGGAGEARGPEVGPYFVRPLMLPISLPLLSK